MATITDNQYIVKRQKNSHSRHNIKSAGTSREFMSHFSQKPVSSNRNRKKIPFWKKFSFPRFTEQNSGRNNTNRNRTYSNSKFKNSGTNRKAKDEKARGSGFSFPVPSAATIAVVAGTVILALAALNWEDLDIKTPDTYAFQFTETTNVEQNTIQYAATGVSSLLPSFSNQPEANTGETAALQQNSAEIPTLNTNNDNPHGMLLSFEWQPYKVQRGDSVSTIAQKFGVSVGAIIASNEITNARRLQAGASLRIPSIDGIPYQIKRGDSLSQIAVSFNVPLEVILDVNDIKSDNIRAGETIFIPGARMNDIDLRKSLGELFMFPLQTRHVTSPFGWRRDPFTGAQQFHRGVDFRANIGTPVMAALDGVVSVVGENWLYGKFIIMTHSNGYKTLYGHLNSFNVREGDRVARGRKIAETGNTGYSTGPHLHFEIFDRNNNLVNPLELLK